MNILIKDETFSDYKSILSNYDNLKKTYQSSPKLSKYEETSIIGIRSQQIAHGAQPLISVPKHVTSTIEIAEEELKQHKTPFILQRQVGNKIEYWKIEDLIF